MKNHTKLVRNIPDDSMLAIIEQASREATPRSKTGLRRPDSNQIIVHATCIRSLGFPLCYQVEEIEHLALQIAQRQRSQREMQSQSSVQAKLEMELSELAKAQGIDEQRYRLASVVYYYSQRFLHDHDRTAFLAGLQRLSTAYAVPVDLLMLICLAKFRDRASRDHKDVPSEKRAISMAETNFFD